MEVVLGREGRDGIGPGEAAGKGTRQRGAAILYRMWEDMVRGTPAEWEAVATATFSGMQGCNPQKAHRLASRQRMTKEQNGGKAVNFQGRFTTEITTVPAS